ncbi:MAG TPA: preprotein translocase subunit SecA [Candidatus Paceibacterota bacterium]|jgi:preprotein translocase subunit SecA|nr:preprotein translocase subunit SecA [Candidatus Paceibacterota bacterium]
MSIFSKLFGGNHTASVKKFEPMVAQINALEPAIQKLSDIELKEKSAGFRKRLQETKTREEEAKILDEILPEAFALVREAGRRTLGQRHFDVQLIGGMVLNSGGIAEMRTGEGKTLVATLSAYLNALSGKGVHVVTVNDYLSRRDAAWMGQIYDALGLSVAVINHDSSFMYDPAHRTKEEDKTEDELGSFKIVHEFLRPVTRREAYAADITYGTNNEFGFDYLRDNLEYDPAKLRQREPNYVVVDEIDSILIDEARTPLIISAPTRDAESVYKQFASLVTSYKKDEDYTVDEKKKAIQLLDAGIEKAEKALGIANLYTDAGIKFVHHLETAVRAKALYSKDVDYVVKNNEIVIVDTFTGRLQPGRRWSEGLHQAIEAKEGVSIQQESRTYASITFQNFFRMYPKLSGMTGTASTSSEEFFKVYGLSVYQVPTNRTAVRLDLQDQIFQTEVGKFKAIARKVKELHSKGQPVLIGTVSIEKNELLSQFLKGEGVPHEMLNAKNHEREGEIVAQAGKKGAVTIATNMAGRGVDIKLGGNPNTPALYEEIKSVGGLFVLGTERHEARRIDDQLRGRAGRQGDPGATQFFVSLEDSLMRVFASDTLKSMMGKLGVKEDEPIQHSIISKSLENAQKKIEGFNFDSRKHVLEFDDVINSQRTSIYKKRRALLLGSVDEVEKELNEILGTGTQLNDQVTITNDQKDIQDIVAKKISEFGREDFLNAIRIVLLQTIDMYWVEHLEVMDYTRSSVNLRAYGQRDPLIEYKKEGLRLFREMNAAIRDQFIRILPNIVPVNKSANAKGMQDAEFKEIHENAQLIGAGDGSSKGGNSQAKSAPEVGRNDPCPCGSGKKYKKCHGVGK